MKFISLFSGIGGFDVGLERAGMQCVAQVEKDKQALSVLEKHWPKVPRFDDVATFKKKRGLSADLIAGGFPCQDVSVAGKRAGLAGERSGLFWEFMRIVSDFAPRWVLIENVPGLLSSNGGKDMAAVVMALAERGYGWAYRVLDSQYFGLAQRRERVFIVGCLGDARRASQVLFESESLPWDTSPSRATKQTVAGILGGSSDERRRGQRNDLDDNGACIPVDNGGGISLALSTGGYFDATAETFIADSYTDGTYQKSDVARPVTTGTDRSRGTPLVATTLRSRQSSPGVPMPGRGGEDDASLFCIPLDMRQASRGEKMTNNRPGGSSGGAPGTGIGEDGDPSPTIAESHVPAIAYNLHSQNSCAMKGNGDAQVHGNQDGIGAKPGEVMQRAGMPETGACQGVLRSPLHDDQAKGGAGVGRGVRRLTPL